MLSTTAASTLLASPLSPDNLLDNFGVIGLSVILFAECGLLIGFFLPGDTILLAAGISLAVGTISAPIEAFLIAAPIGAILGNLVGYAIGRRAGPVVFDRPRSKLFRPEYVTRAHDFFERFGWATIFLARFVPIVRTVASVMAGVSHMRFRNYVVASVVGGIVWTDGIILLGYWLGHFDFVREHKSYIDYIVIGAVVLGLIPTLIHLLRQRPWKRREGSRMTRAYETIDRQRHGAVVVLTLDRPDEANSLDPQLGRDLAAAAGDCDADPSVKAVVLTATGRFFCAGGDVRSMVTFGDDIRVGIKGLADDLHRAISTFTRMSAPVVVAVNGVAAGAGFSIASSGDLVLAAESATFTMAYTKIALSPDGSASYFLPRVIGLRRTQELMLTNRTLSAAEAAEWGIVTRVVADDALLEEALALATTLASGSLGAHGAVKRLLAATFANSVETQMELEARCITECAAASDGREGIAAFVERRRPDFG